MLCNKADISTTYNNKIIRLSRTEDKSKYQNLIVKVSDAEYQQLKESIKEDGLYYPIAVNPDYVILDGHHRYCVCVELGIEPWIEIFKFANKLQEIKFI